VYGSINALSANFGTIYTAGTTLVNLNVTGISNLLGNVIVGNLIVTGNLVNVTSNTQFSNSVSINNAGTSTALKVHQLENTPTHTNNVAEFWDYQTLALLINGLGNVGIHTTVIDPYAFAVVGASNLDYIKTINLYSSNAVVTSNLFGNVVGSNTVSASTIYGTLAGANTITGSSVSATTLYGRLAGSNTVAGSTLYGQLAGSNTISGSSLTLGTALSIANGGTGQTTKSAAFDSLSPMSVAGDLIYGGASGTGTRLATGSVSQVLHGGTTPSWSAVSLTTDVSGTLPVASGGTGLTSTSANFVFAGPTTGAATAPTWRALVSADIPNNAASTSSSAGSLSTTFTSNYVLFGQGTGVPNYSSLLTWDGTTLKANDTGTSAGIYGKRFYASAIGDNTDTPTTSDNAGGPWYGLGYSVDTGLTTYVQLAGWAGLSFKTGTGLNVMDSTGRIGIGSTTPGYPLDVSGKIRSSQLAMVGYTNIVHRRPIWGVGEFAGAIYYSTTSASTYIADLISTYTYNPLGAALPAVATGATRSYRLYAISSDNMQAGSGFQIRFNLDGGGTLLFTLGTTWGDAFSATIDKYSDSVTSTNTSHANSISFIIPNGTTGKASGGGTLSPVNVKIDYIELQAIDQY
jgi:hypothetical protein